MKKAAVTRRKLDDYDLQIELSQRVPLKCDRPDPDEQFVASLHVSLLLPDTSGAAPPELAGSGSGVMALGQLATLAGDDLREVCDAVGGDLWTVYELLQAAGLPTDSDNLLWLEELAIVPGRGAPGLRRSAFQSFFGSVTGVPTRFAATTLETVDLKAGREQPAGWERRVPDGCHVFLDEGVVVWDAQLEERIQVWLTDSEDADGEPVEPKFELGPGLDAIVRGFTAEF